MPSIVTVLRNMIRRLARREIKAHTSSTKRAVAQFRRDIAWLKRQMRSQEREIALLKAEEQKCLAWPQAKEGPLKGVRFSAGSVKAQRRRLGLSAANYGKLVGVSGVTVYNWEWGMFRPRPAQLAALVALRRIGKRAALAKLAAIRGHPGTS